MLNIIKAVCVIIGTIIGAGFASGREIYIFFNIYGTKGILGIIIASTITGSIIYKVLKQIQNKDVENYYQYTEEIGIRNRLKEIINIIINIFLLISFYIMVAGFCAYFKQEFNIPVLFVGVIMAGACYFTFMNSIEGVTKINTILIPILICIIVFIGIKIGLNKGEMESLLLSTNKGNWIISSIEYASYNSILLIPILIGLKKYSQYHEKAISIISTIAFFILAITLYYILSTNIGNIQTIELPLVYIVNQYGYIYKYICGIVIVAAIFTSAISAGYGFIQNYAKSKKGYRKTAIFICISSLFVINIGFSKLVDLLYPVFGLLSLLQLFFIVKEKT